MAVFFSTFTALLGSLALASSRDAGRFMKTVPTISNSLVNLGKMEIAFYFNEKGPVPSPIHEHSMQDDFISSPSADQSCACSYFKRPQNSFLTNPTEIINKILKSKDLFKDPTSSLCCGSHEHMQESTVFMEFVPNQGQNFNVQHSAEPITPFPVFERLINKASPNKPKAVEILLFPKRKDMATFEYTNFPPIKNNAPKAGMEVIEHKETNFKQPSASVKKDLALLEKKKKQEVEVDEDSRTTTPTLNYDNNNAL